MFAASKSGRKAAATTDPYFPYVPLLLETTSTNGQQNNTFLDSSTNNFTLTRSGTPTQGSVTPYWPNGYWSNYLGDLLSNYLTISSPGTNLQFTGDFTVEMWYFVISGAEISVFIEFTSPNYFAININPSGNAFSIYLNSSSPTFSPTATIPLSQWNHIALVRSGSGAGNVKLYLNGTALATTGTNTSTLGFASPTYARIGGGGAAQIGGYVSNFRVVKGTAVYTGNFTPPTAPLTAITNTTLLTCQSNRFVDNSSNALALALTGTPQVQAFQPFSPAASYTTAAYGGSGYFNGSSDYLTSNITASTFGSNSFTIELWVYFFSNTGGYKPIITSQGTGDYYGWVLITETGNNLTFYGSSSGGTSWGVGNMISSYVPPINAWTHLVITRDNSQGTQFRMFANGVLISSATSSSAIISGTSNTVLGYYPYFPGGGRYLNAYYGNVRLINGSVPASYQTSSTTVGTQVFTPPTSPLAAVTNTSLLLNFTNAGIYDAAVQNNAITVGDAQASTTVSKWSPTSMKFDGTGDWLTSIDGPQLQLGTGDFTIDGWVYLSATGVAYGIISKGTASTGWSVNVTSGNKLQFSYTASNLTGATSLSASTWYYFAVVRSGSATGNLKIYLNATADATSGGAVTDNFNQTNTLYVGADRVGGSALNGYLQDIRITKYARTITTPTAAFPTR